MAKEKVFQSLVVFLKYIHLKIKKKKYDPIFSKAKNYFSSWDAKNVFLKLSEQKCSLKL